MRREHFRVRYPVCQMIIQVGTKMVSADGGTEQRLEDIKINNK